MVTPIRPIELMLGKTIPFAIVGFVQMMLVTGLAIFLFKVPMRGSFLLLAGASALFLLTTLGAGLFMSTISETQQQAMMATFFFFQPAFMLSGFTLSNDNMPWIIQQFNRFVPSRYFVTILQGIFMKGIGMEVLWTQALFLAGYATFIFVLATRKMRQKMA